MTRTNVIIITLLSVICGILGWMAAQMQDSGNRQEQTVKAVESMVQQVKRQAAAVKIEPEEYAENGGYIIKPTPPYPETALALRQEGKADVEVIVNPDGSVAKAKVIRSSGSPYLDAAALTAAENGRFKAKERDGQAVKTRFTAKYNFKLP